MLRQKCSHRNDIETRKKPEKQRKNRTKVCNQTKQMSRQIQKVFLTNLKVFTLLSMYVLNKWQFSIKKKYDGDNFTPTSPKVIASSKYVGGNRIN